MEIIENTSKNIAAGLVVRLENSFKKTAGAAVMQNRQVCGGFTLIELLVYMAIMGFIIVVAGRAFSDSTKMRVRSQNMLASSEEAGRVSALLKEDISQMGAKSVGISSSSTYTLDTVAAVNINFNTDSSSYTLTKNSPSPFDKLEFRKLHYDATGKCGNLLTIEWSVEGDALIRKCSVASSVPAKCTGTFNAALDCPSKIEMARNVKEFKFLPSIPGPPSSSSGTPTSDIKFPSSGNLFKLLPSYGSGSASPSDGSSRYTLGNFEENTSTSGSQKHSEFYLADVNQSTCHQFTFKKDEVYSIDFFLRCDEESCKKSGTGEKYGSMVLFQPGRDHLSVGLRDPNKLEGTCKTESTSAKCIPDFLFYPPQNTTANKVRHFEFSVSGETKACIGITAAFYGPAAKGILDLENFKVYSKKDNIYHFDHNNPDYNPQPTTTPNKASVKAFELTLEIDKKNEINHTVTVIPVPNNGAMPARESL